MNGKIVGIVGSYRKDGITDTAVSEALKGAESSGAETVKIYLSDKKIEFCNNCRACTQQPGDKRGKCIYDDDMEEILQHIDQADGYVLGSPVNCGTVTAITKRFMERLMVYAYWPWGKIAAPKFRNDKLSKRAIIITSFTPPGWLGRIILPGAARQLKLTAKTLGAKKFKFLYFGMVSKVADSKLEHKNVQKASEAGKTLGLLIKEDVRGN